MSGLFDKTTDALGVSMDARLLRHNVTSANIANAETPGYHAKKVDFEDALTRALHMEEFGKLQPGTIGEPGSPSAIARVKSDVYDNPDVNTSNDKNTVDLEREMATLAENTILYRAATELIKKKLGAMRYVASEGR